MPTKKKLPSNSFIILIIIAEAMRGLPLKVSNRCSQICGTRFVFATRVSRIFWETRWLNQTMQNLNGTCKWFAHTIIYQSLLFVDDLWNTCIRRDAPAFPTKWYKIQIAMVPCYLLSNNFSRKERNFRVSLPLPKNRCCCLWKSEIRPGLSEKWRCCRRRRCLNK